MQLAETHEHILGQNVEIPKDRRQVRSGRVKRHYEMNSCNTSLTTERKSDTQVAECRSVIQKPAVVPLSLETACSGGLSSIEPETTTTADERPLPANHYQPPYDSNVLSVDNSSKTIKPEQPCFEVVESCATEKGVGEDQQELEEHDQRIIFSLISVGLDTMVDEIRRMRRHPESMGITM
ncbi:hypothetical protein HPB51_001939 [Rhipicephalus microplus]|uniref:Uncharacterized protein n=1 Tax=Rhipicephalus microplus TaxID=6941 RepID=A0A9J6EEV4_RHIMP|nr:hypothetical protein HPB51_001939 [Rhipicephalus microplus]